MFWIETQAWLDRLLALMIALGIGLLLFGARKLRRWLWVEAAGRQIVRAIHKVEGKLNREHRSAGTRVYRGIILLLFFLVLTVLPAIGIHMLSRYWAGGIYIEMLLLAAIIPLWPLLDETRQVSQAIRHKKMDRARQQAAGLARREHGELDGHSVIRVTIEYLMENMSDKVIAPCIWYLLLGFPGAVAARIINQLDGAVGHKSRRFIAFGWASARCDDVIQLIPARITGLLLCIAALFTPRGRPLGAVLIVWRDAGKTTSPNSGWPIAAAAGALGLTLAGPRRVAEGVVRDAWIGKGTSKPFSGDLVRAQWLYALAILLWVVVLAGLIAALLTQA